MIVVYIVDEGTVHRGFAEMAECRQMIRSLLSNNIPLSPLKMPATRDGETRSLAAGGLSSSACLRFVKIYCA